MKIIIDARLYGSSHGGIGRYIEELIKNLEKTDSNNLYVIILAKNNFDEYIPRNRNFKKILADYKIYGFKEQFFLPGLINKHKPDLVHFPHFNAPLFFGGRFVVTIHDLIISHHPTTRASTLDPFTYWLKILLYRLVISHAVKKSWKIVTVSQYTKKDIMDHFKTDPEKISVIYEGADLPKTIENKKVLEELGITKDFLLYVGSAYPHKNLENLILAFQKMNSDCQLVLVGKKNRFYQELEDNIPDNLKSRIILTDYLPDEKLASLYQSAKLYVFPSLIEGFGLPPLEAQSYGLPVVSSNATCLPEILGESAMYFNPNNIEDMAGKMDLVLKDESLRQELREKGYGNLKRFSWKKTALQTLEIYSSLDKK